MSPHIWFYRVRLAASESRVGEAAESVDADGVLCHHGHQLIDDDEKLAYTLFGRVVVVQSVRDLT